MIELDKLVEALKASFSSGLELTEDGQAIIVDKNIIRSLLITLKNNFNYKMLIDITAVDFSEYFEVVYHVMSLDDGDLIRIKTKLPADDPKVQSVMMVWKTADVLEREIFDLMGIDFEDHSDLKRIFMDEDFEGHPLRKDYIVETVERW